MENQIRISDIPAPLLSRVCPCTLFIDGHSKGAIKRIYLATDSYRIMFEGVGGEYRYTRESLENAILRLW